MSSAQESIGFASFGVLLVQNFDHPVNRTPGDGGFIAWVAGSIGVFLGIFQSAYAMGLDQKTRENTTVLFDRHHQSTFRYRLFGFEQHNRQT